MHARTFLIALLLLGFSVTFAQAGTVLLDANGAVVQLETGTYGELFPNSNEMAAGHQVLALSVRTRDVTERLLVPGTESPWVETSATLVKDHGTVWVLWEGLHNAIHPLLYLVGHDGTSWGEVIEITGNPFAAKGHPQVAVTRNGDDSAATRVHHVVWWEDLATGSRKRLAPIVLFGDQQVGGTQPIDLIDFLGDVEFYREPASELANLLTLQQGATNRSVVVGFTDPRTGHLASLVIESLPEKLGALADNVRDQVLDVGKLTSDYSELATQLLEVITELEETGFLPSSLEYLGEQVAAAIAGEDANTSLPTLGEKIRQQMINIGARIERGGLEGETMIAQIELGDGHRNHWLAVTVAAHREAPLVGGPATMSLSPDGKHMLLAWDEDGAVAWIESQDDRWSEVGRILVDPTMSRETAHSILQQRVHDR
ncbi:MAG: hypothetical protein AAGD38_11430 [Acidobacteriota bacterium]